MQKILSGMLLGWFITWSLFAQEPRAVTMGGYVTALQSAMFDSLSGPFVNENVIHNRLNIEAVISPKLTAAAGIRNRLFTGDRVRMDDVYAGMIGRDDGWADMSWNLAEEQSLLLNTTIDRLSLNLNLGSAAITLGRQRINWGQTVVWNPNDIFNAYSFFDVDYMERPGSDALRIEYFPTASSTVELAVKANHDNNITAAALFRFNKWGYDIQFLGGLVNSNDVVLGAGWSGAISSFAFRGEISWFEPYRHRNIEKSSVLATLGTEKVFSDKFMAQLQFMYCNEPVDWANDQFFHSGSLDAKELAFSTFSAFGQFTWTLTPLLNVSASAMWFPDLSGYYAGPSLNYSLAENIDFSLLWQHVDAEMTDQRMRMNLGFLKLTYHF
ncbi:MAG: hypothetical protein JXQ80_05295 [Bacteroidales bacterium]|nr:hypothetical protein [Bacteroidales bacterium]